MNKKIDYQKLYTQLEDDYEDQRLRTIALEVEVFKLKESLDAANKERDQMAKAYEELRNSLIPGLR